MKRILTHSLLRSAEKYPERISFSQNEINISYADLVSKSHSLANFLSDLGIRKGDRIGIFMNRSIESAYSIYGIMACGATYVPIDTRLPIGRIEELIEDCTLQVLITATQFKAKISRILKSQSALKYIIGIEDLVDKKVSGFSWSDIFSFSDRTPSYNVSETDNAYIIYTSGTTGKPKGIVHTHYSGYSYAKLSTELYNITPSDILGNFSHLHFDQSTMGYLTMPYASGCSVIIPEAHTIFPMNLAKLIASKKMTIWYSVPLVLAQLLNTGILNDLDYSNLRWVLFGGEQFDKKYIEAMFQYLPEAQFSNVYGPAEVNQCTYYNFDSKTTLENPIPIGKAWPETKVKIKFDSEDTTDVGKLLVHSSTQMKEYWNQEALTEESFEMITDVSGNVHRYYKTGDLVRQVDNDIIFLGRSDRQIKVRGYRVELNEVENAFQAIGNIEEVAIYPIKEKDDQWTICADVVCAENSITEVEIRRIISQALPPQSIPTHIRFRQSIPRTSAGKVDYKSLTK